MNTKTSIAYNVPFGYKVSVVIVRNDDLDEAKVNVIAPIYKRKEWFMSHSYKSSEFSDSQILNDRDFISCMCKSFPK